MGTWGRIRGACKKLGLARAQYAQWSFGLERGRQELDKGPWNSRFQGLMLGVFSGAGFGRAVEARILNHRSPVYGIQTQQ